MAGRSPYFPVFGEGNNLLTRKHCYYTQMTRETKCQPRTGQGHDITKHGKTTDSSKRPKKPQAGRQKRQAARRQTIDRVLLKQWIPTGGRFHQKLHVGTKKKKEQELFKHKSSATLYHKLKIRQVIPKNTRFSLSHF